MVFHRHYQAPQCLGDTPVEQLVTDQIRLEQLWAHRRGQQSPHSINMASTMPLEKILRERMLRVVK